MPSPVAIRIAVPSPCPPATAAAPAMSARPAPASTRGARTASTSPTSEERRGTERAAKAVDHRCVARPRGSCRARHGRRRRLAVA